MYIYGAAIWQWWHKACLQGDGWLQPGWNCLACNSAGIYHSAPVSESALLNTAIQLFVQCIYVSWRAYSEQLTIRATLEKKQKTLLDHPERLQGARMRKVIGQGFRHLITQHGNKLKYRLFGRQIILSWFILITLCTTLALCIWQ